MKKQILVFGAGAVGLVYGKHFSDAGHDVTFFVKEKYLEQLSKGAVLYNLNRDKQKNKPIRYTTFSLISKFEEVKQQDWDQIYLCFSSTALQAFDFTSLKNNLAGVPTIVMLQPGTEDYQVLTKTFPPEQIVEGMITLISYTTPLPTEKVSPEGVAYWFPPLAPTPFAGTDKRKNEVIEVFKSGKIRANSTKSVQLQALFPSAFLGTFLTALEASDWNFNALKSNRHLLKLLQQSINEVYLGLESKYKTERPFLTRFINTPWMVKMLLKLAPRVMPMDIESYFEYHFTKVNDQTKMFMNEYLMIAKSSGNTYKALEELIQLN